MALDEVLLEEFLAGRRGPTLRFWGWTAPTLVIGSNQSVANEVDEVAAARRGFVVTRRLSGGGTMIAEPGGTITWSLYLPGGLVGGMSFARSYEFLDVFAVEALRGLGVAAGYRALNDIIDAGGGKIAGAAQARRRDAVLHHVTMAWSTEPDVVADLIRLGRPPRNDRGVRSAEKRVSPLARLVAPGLTREDAVAALAARFGGEPGALTADEKARADELVATKYGTQSWIHRLA